MPFTISHIAAVLPMRKQKLSFSALAIGAMSPDFSYILALVGLRFESHSLRGMLIFSLPAALIVWWLYEYYLKGSWSRVFPWLGSHTKRVSYFAVLTSVVFGILTHVVWDSFTHLSGWPVANLSFLRERFSFGPLGTKPLYNLLQHLSSIVGLTVLVLALTAHLLRTRTALIGSWRIFLMSVILGCAVSFMFCMPMIFAEPRFFETATFEARLVQIAFRLLAAMAVTLVAFPPFLALRDRA